MPRRNKKPKLNAKSPAVANAELPEEVRDGMRVQGKARTSVRRAAAKTRSSKSKSKRKGKGKLKRSRSDAELDKEVEEYIALTDVEVTAQPRGTKLSADKLGAELSEEGLAKFINTANTIWKTAEYERVVEMLNAMCAEIRADQIPGLSLARGLGKSTAPLATEFKRRWNEQRQEGDRKDTAVWSMIQKCSRAASKGDNKAGHKKLVSAVAAALAEKHKKVPFDAQSAADALDEAENDEKQAAAALKIPNSTDSSAPRTKATDAHIRGQLSGTLSGIDGFITSHSTGVDDMVSAAMDALNTFLLKYKRAATTRRKKKKVKDIEKYMDDDFKTRAMISKFNSCQRQQLSDDETIDELYDRFID